MKKIKTYFFKIALSILTGIGCALFAFFIKYCTEFTEEHFFSWLIQSEHRYLLFVFPVVGLLLVWLFSTVIFKAPLRGIVEVLDAARSTSSKVSPKRIFAHYLGGFFTVAMGGSTGIEVSTVVSGAAIGSSTANEFLQSDKFTRYLLIAGGAAGISALFNSPLGGLFFAFEVLAVSFSIELLAFVLLAIISASYISFLFGATPFVPSFNHSWKLHALPFFVGLSVVAAFLSAYLTRSVVMTKYFFQKRMNGVTGVIIGGVIVGLAVFFLHPLFGEGYATIKNLLSGNIGNVFQGTSEHNASVYLMMLLALVILKPLITSLTLASGGDGGVFAPSLFIGAVLGFLFSSALNQWVGADLITMNFVIVGMAALLGATIHAPLTAIFLVVSLTHSFDLIVPLTITSFLSYYFSKKILPYTVYSYGRKKEPLLPA
ncbi:MAG: chloride channel protein [Chryseolinea sp.]